MAAFWKDNKHYFTWMSYLIVLVVILVALYPVISIQKSSRLIQATVSGVLVGGLYSLTGLGIVVVTKASGVFNFAHGFMMVIGALTFFSFFTTKEIPVGAAFALALITSLLVLTTNVDEPRSHFWRRQPDNPVARVLLGVARRLAIPHFLRPEILVLLAGSTAVLTFLMAVTVTGIDLKWLHAIVGTLVGVVLLGLIIERLAIRPLVGQPLFAMILMTLAVSEVLQGAVQFIWGPQDKALPIFADIEKLGITSPIRLEGSDGVIIIKTELVIAFLLAILAAVGFILLFRYAQIGLAMRAVSENQKLAQSVGLRVRSILGVVWGLAAILAGIAGVLTGGATSVTPAIAFVALRAFPAVLLGGLESVEGVLLGGVVIGLVEQWASLLFGTHTGPELAPYLVLMIVLIIRPEGLFGEKLIERI